MQRRQFKIFLYSDNMAVYIEIIREHKNKLDNKYSGTDQF